MFSPTRTKKLSEPRTSPVKSKSPAYKKFLCVFKKSFSSRLSIFTALFFTALFFPALLSLSVQATTLETESWQKHREWFEQQNILEKGAKPQYVNNLINEASPYLLSHSLQPVDWQPWSQSTWDLAKTENKLVYLSIGYQTCHWCHVIAEESYQDAEIANILNQNFISVKVDREVQVDVDNRYRRALENMSGEAGWPIQVILTPDQKILWIDSYLPKDQVSNVLDRLSNRWQTNSELIQSIAQGLNQRLLPPLLSESNSEEFSSNQLQEFYSESLDKTRQILQVELAGTGPRFLRADWLLLFLDQYQQAPNTNQTYLQLVEQQIEQLLTSPTYDIVEGGVHRYAVDGYWQVPHYEKMLYDQAMLIRVLSKLYTFTGNQSYSDFAFQTVNWVNNNLKLSSENFQGFASSMSAISTETGLEGDYYRLKTNILISDPFANWGWVSNDGGALVHNRVASPLNHQEQSLLYSYRDPNKKPDIDKKWILSWNALYLIALNELYLASGKTSIYADIAELTDSLLNAYRDETNELHRIRFENSTSMDATLEDYSLATLAIQASSQSLLSFEIQKTATEILGKKLVNKLQNADWSNLLQDGELPATAALSYEALNGLLQIEKSDDYLNALELLKKNSLPIISLTEPKYMALSGRIASDLNRRPTFDQFSTSFASGNGLAKLKRIENELWIDLKLAPNWHINAPTNFEATNTLKITTIQSDYYPNLEADFPTPITKTFSFFNEPLSLYEGLTSIKLNENNTVIPGARIKISTQACSDRLCLLPEEFELLVPPD